MSSNEIDSADISATTEDIPEPHGAWWHPHRSWVDLFYEAIGYWIIPKHRVVAHPPHRDSASALSATQTIRQTFTQFKNQSLAGDRSQGFHLWEKIAGDGGGGSPIVEVVYKVKRRPTLLEDWGIISSSSELPPYHECVTLSRDIQVNLFFPASVLLNRGEKTAAPKLGEKTEFGLHRMEPKEFNFSDFGADIPLVVFFHGGGMVMGDAHDNAGLELLVKMMKAQSDPNMIVASVEYSLAPEHPFPVPTLEALTVVAHFIETNPGRNIHVSGISAGGYLAVVTGMECFRRYPGRLQSVVSICPMLDPACDSLGYHLTSKSSSSFNAFVRWCWQAFLELPTSQDKELRPPNTNATLDAVLALDSNRTTWNESKWKGTALERLIKPIVGVPPGLDDGEKAPTILLVTNRADPMCYEGKEYVQRLQSVNAKVSHLDFNGTHWMGTWLDPKAQEELVSAWRKLIYDESRSS